MSALRPPALALAAFLAAAWPGGARGAGEPPPGADSAPIATVDGVPSLTASDMARLLGATQYWRSDVRKLMLRSGTHTIKLTAENPFVLVDEHAYLLPRPVRMIDGQLLVPVAFFDLAWPDSLRPQVRIDADQGRATRRSEPATRGSVQLTHSGGLTRLTLRVSDPGARGSRCAPAQYRWRSCDRRRRGDSRPAARPGAADRQRPGAEKSPWSVPRYDCTSRWAVRQPFAARPAPHRRPAMPSQSQA